MGLMIEYGDLGVKVLRSKHSYPEINVWKIIDKGMRFMKKYRMLCMIFQ